MSRSFFHPASGAHRRPLRLCLCAVRAAGAALPVLVLLLGCSGFSAKEEPPGPWRITATAVGKAPAEAEWSALLGLEAPPVSEPPDLPSTPAETVARVPGKDFPKWASETLRTQAEIAFPDAANSHVQALLLARREARDGALADLAARIAAFPSPRGGTVLDALDEREEMRAEMEQTLRASVVFTAEEDTDSQYRVSAEVPLRPIALVLFGETRESRRAASRPAPPAPPPQRVAVFPADSRRIAREQALQEARRALMERVRATLLSEGYTLGDHMDRTPNAAAYVRMAVDHALEEKVTWPDDQTCEMTLSLDLEPILRRLWEKYGY